MAADLQGRLDRIERRQKYVLALLAYPYLLGLLWMIQEPVEPTRALTAIVPVLAMAVVAYLLALYRARAGST